MAFSYIISYRLKYLGYYPFKTILFFNVYNTNIEVNKGLPNANRNKKISAVKFFRIIRQSSENIYRIRAILVEIYQQTISTKSFGKF